MVFTDDGFTTTLAYFSVMVPNESVLIVKVRYFCGTATCMLQFYHEDMLKLLGSAHA